MRVLIVGGTVFIGPHVVRALLADGHDLTLFHRGQHERDDLAATVDHIHGDRSEIGRHRDAIERTRPDVVLDMRPMTGREATAVLEAVRGIAGRIVGVSSVDVYRAYGRLHGSEPGPPEPTPLTEDSPLRERLYPYRGEGDDATDEYDKILVERAYLADPEVTGTILRLPAVHGEGDYQHRLFMELSRLDAGRPFVLLQQEAAQWRWPRAYAGNVAEAIALAVTDERTAGRVYNVGEPETLTQREWLRSVGEIAGWRGEIVEAPGDVLPPHLRVLRGPAQDMDVDSTRIRSELGFVEPVAPEEGVRRAIAWERAHPPRRAEASWTDFALDDEARRKLATM